MVTVNYYLKGALSEKAIAELRNAGDPKLQTELRKPRQVFLMVSGLGDRMQIYTKKRVSQYEWDKEKQQIDTRGNKVSGPEINEWLLRFHISITRLCRQHEMDGKRTTIEDLRSTLAGHLPSAGVKTELTFKDYFSQFLEEHKTREGHSKRRRTIQKYNTLYTHLDAFATKGGKKLRADAIDGAFLASFRNYLLKDLGMADNTVAKYIKSGKTLLRYMISRGLVQPIDLAQVKSTEREGEMYIINLKQLIRLQQFPIESPRLDHCRDVFCFQCWTGQRYSDIEAMRREDLKVNEQGEKIWELHTVKTGESIRVPIVEYAEMILDKYRDEDRPLPLISNQKQNEYLKELGKLVSSGSENQPGIEGFAAMTRTITYHDGIRREEYVPFHEVLTTHVARKSYITNSLVLGVSERVVREVSGHKSEKDFRRYVNLANRFKDEMIRKSFSAENLRKFI